MKAISFTLLLLAFSAGLFTTAYAQTSSIDKYRFLFGEWIGDGEGTPGAGSGQFSFTPDLDNRVIIRKNHVSLPATADRAAYIHDDIVMLYSEEPGQLDHAIFADNEDHIIHYKVTIEEEVKVAVFQSEPNQDKPGFKLIYTLTDADHVTITFQMAEPGATPSFQTYLTLKAHRKR